MRRSTLNDGTPFLGIKIEHFVTKTVFAKAIASHCWTYGEDFDPKTSKTDAMNILKKNLFHQGIEGLNIDNWDGASIEFQQPFKDAYESAIEWIEKNYPYLK